MLMVNELRKPRRLDLDCAHLAARLDDQPNELLAPVGNEGHWYVIVCQDQQENLASAHLVGRRFGVFDPTFEETYVVRGHERTRRSRLLPGYLLVFVWDLEKSWRRIRACPGVQDFLRRAGTMEPVVVPDVLVEYLQGRELSWCIPVWEEIARRPARAGSRNRRRTKLEREELRAREQSEIIMEVSTGSHLRGIEDVDPAERIRRFNEAIGNGVEAARPSPGGS